MADRWIYVGGPSGADAKGGAAQVLAAHAALVPIGDGRCILYFGGSQWTPPNTWGDVEILDDPMKDPRYAAGLAEIDHTRIYDCATQVVTNPLTPSSDLFCSGHAFLPDGRLAIMGGTQHCPPPSKDYHHDHFSLITCSPICSQTH
jgi:hypothetical protein